MTAFPWTQPDNETVPVEDVADTASTYDNWAHRAARTDELVAKARATATPTDLDKRAVKRLSMAEINSRDWSKIQPLIEGYHADNRGPITRFLDLLDVPRNAIVGVMASKIKAQRQAEGETGAFGQGKVYFSDVLGELGMRPGIIRGALGLVGDVALDPLTWIGSPGGIAKAATTGGEIVRTGIAGTRAIKAATKAIKAGEAIRDTNLRAVYDATVKPWHDAETAAGRVVTNEQRAAKFSEAMRDAPNRLYEPIVEGEEVAPATRAAKDFYAEATPGAPATLQESAGKATLGGGPRLTSKGLAFGSGVQAYAHVPFTELGIYGPGFTKAARAYGVQRMIALAREGASPELTGLLGLASSAAATAETASTAIRDAYDTFKGHREAADVADAAHARAAEEYKAAVEDLRTYAPDDPNRAIASFNMQRAAFISGTARDEAKAAQEAASDARARVDELRATLDNHVHTMEANIRSQVERATAQGIPPFERMGVNDMLYVRQQLERARAARDAIAAQAAAEPAYNHIANIFGKGEIDLSEIGNPATVLKIRNDTLNASKATAHAELLGNTTNHAGDADYIANNQRIGMLEEALAHPDIDEASAQYVSEQLGVAREVRDAAAAAHAKDIRTRQISADWLKRVAEMSNDEIDEMAVALESHFQNMAAKNHLATALGGSLLDHVSATGPERTLADISRTILGISPDDVGESVFTGMRSGARSILGEGVGADIDRHIADMQAAGRGYFGNKAARLNEARAAQQRALLYSADSEARRLLDPFYKIVTGMDTATNTKDAVSLADKYGLTTPEQVDRMFHLATIRMAQKLRELHPTRTLTHDVVDGELVENALAQTIRESKEAGWFGGGMDQAKYDGLLKDVDRLADAAIEVLDKSGLNAVDSGALGGLRQGHIPNALTDFGRKAINESGAKAFGSEAASASPQTVTPAQAFTKNRSSDVYQWKSVLDGEWHQINEWDIQNAPSMGGNPAWLESSGLSPEAIDHYRKIADDVADFRASHPMPDGALSVFGSEDNWRRTMLAKNADPISMNTMFGSRLAVLHGNSPTMLGHDLFSTNLLHIMENYAKQYVTDAAARSGYDLLERTRVPVEKEAIKQVLGKNAEFVLGNGARGRITRSKDASGKGEVFLTIGDNRYRQLRGIDYSKLATDSFANGLLHESQSESFFPEQVAEFIERMYHSGTGEDKVGPILKALDKFTTLWKSSTLAHPSWIVFNALGNLWQLASSEVPLDGVVKHARDAMSIVMHKLSPELEGRTITFANGETHTLAELSEEAGSRIGRDTTRATEAMHTEGPYKSATYGSDILPREKGIKAAFTRAKDATTKAFNDRMQIYADQHAATSSKASVRAGAIASAIGHAAYDASRRNLLQPFFRLNSKLEEWTRMAAYLAARDAGHDPENAARAVKEALYDFQDMTDFERTYGRRILPFYSWMRNNAARQAHLLLTQPKWAASVPRVKHAIEDALSGEASVPEHLRPTWMREQLAIQIGENPDDAWSVMIGNVIPTEPANNLGGLVVGGAAGIQNAIKFVTSGFNPVVNTPLQIGAGREAFSGRSIGPSEQADLSLSDFTLGQLRPIREFVPLGPRQSPIGAATPGLAVARTLLGGRAQPFTRERLTQHLAREYKDREDALRKYITTASKNGKEDLATKARAHLLMLYQDMASKGLKIPKWAHQQLGQLQTAQ